MNTAKMGPAGRPVSSLEVASDALVDRVAQHSCAALGIARDQGEQNAGSTETFPRLPALAKPQSLRVAIKVRGKILFINLDDVASIQAKGNCVWLQQKGSSYLLRESISVVAERLAGQWGTTPAAHEYPVVWLDQEIADLANVVYSEDLLTSMDEPYLQRFRKKIR